MKIRQAVVVSILILLGIAGAGAVLALYTEVSVRASSPSLSDALSNIPSDYQFVFGMNVKRFVQSPAYTKVQQGKQIGSDLAVFTEKTGVDPARDISFLVGAGHAKEGTGGQGVVIVAGTFNKDAITSYIRSKSGSVGKDYNGKTVIMIPDPKTDAVQKGIAFLNDQEIALGDLESLKATVDNGGEESKSILSSATISPLIPSISADDMFWFLGDAAGVLSNAPAATLLGTSIPSIKNIVGTLNFGAAVITGKVTATALNPDAAQKLADMLKGLIAIGQLTGAQRPELKALLGGLAVSYTPASTQVSVELNFPADMLEKFGQSRQLGR
jgi:hypothetical protein